MAKRLTSVSIENAKPRPQRYEISDGGSGLRLVVFPTGHRAWIVRYRRPPPSKKTAKLTHEHFVPLAEPSRQARFQRGISEK